jgi:hypothetical protein
MKKIFSIYFALIFSVFAYGQKTPCEAQWLPKVGSISATNPVNTSSGTNTGIYTSGTCNASEENPLWYKFVSKGSVINFTVNTSNCTGGNNGLSFAVFKPRTPNCVDLVPTSNCTKQISGSGNKAFPTVVKPDELYYLQVDGLSGSKCDFTISYVTNEISTGFATLRGNVFWDKNQNCKADATDVKLRDALIVIKKSATDSVFASISENGAYELTLPLGNYTTYCKMGGEKRLWNATACSQVQKVDLILANEVVQNDFFVAKNKDCGIIESSISSNQFSADGKTVLKVKYKNIGTSKVNSAYAKVQISPALSMIGVSQPFSKTNNTIVVNLGDIEAQQESGFDISVKTNANVVQNQTITNILEIFPNPVCFDNPSWDGSEIKVYAVCDKDSVRIGAKNVGISPIISPWIIIEDDVVILTKKVTKTLNAFDSLSIATVYATGKTYRFEAGQSPNFPRRSMPTVSVEGCKATGSTATVTYGWVGQMPQDDADFYNDIDVREVEIATNYSSLLAYPRGVTAERLLSQNQDLEYIVRFRNKNLQTIKSLIMVDTLSPLLDFSTLNMGASNYKFDYEISEKGLLQIKFPNIELFGNQVNKDSSEVYVKFRISQQKDVPLGSLISNRCAFFNSLDSLPSVSAKITHKIAKDFLKVLVKTQENFLPNVSVKVMPNPFDSEAKIIIDGLEKIEKLTFLLIDINGRLLKKMTSDEALFTLQKENLQAGLYFYKIENQGLTISSGKILIE